jgi:hypothetical protein
VSQYVRGDGSLADFPQGGGGGGASVSYYLNLSVSQGSIGGIGYSQMSKVPVFGAGTDTAIASNGYIASFITDAGDPALLQIPAGNWNFETFFSANSNFGSPKFYIELYKVNSGGTATLIASNSATPEDISFGTTIHSYFSALAVPTTTLSLTDRLALRYYVLNSGRTITLHTENSHLCQIITTFTTGLTALPASGATPTRLVPIMLAMSDSGKPVFSEMYFAPLPMFAPMKSMISRLSSPLYAPVSETPNVLPNGLSKVSTTDFSAAAAFSGVCPNILPAA